MGLFVIRFRMFTKHPGQIGCQGTVYKNRQPGYLTGFIQLMEHIDQFLGPAVGKGGDDQGAPRSWVSRSTFFKLPSRSATGPCSRSP